MSEPLGRPQSISENDAGSQNIAKADPTKDDTEDIRNRFCILIHGNGNDEDETRVFTNDCYLLRKALTENAKAAKSNSFVVSEEQLQAIFLKLTSTREQQIMEHLRRCLESDFPHWTETEKVNQLIVDMVLHARCIEAKKKIRESWELQQQKNKLAAMNTYGDKALTDIVERWKKAYSLSDLEKRSVELSRSKSRFESRVDNIVRAIFPRESLSDEIFHQSLYLSGFPVSTKAFLDDSKCMPFFRKTLEHIRSLEKLSNRTEHGANSQDADQESEIFCRVAAYLVDWWKKGVKDQWIWFHYSGHKDCDENVPVKNFGPMIKLACELFTNVVLSLDCCFSVVLEDKEKPPPNLCIIVPNKGNAKAYYGDTYSDFTQHLSYALHGFSFTGCLWHMKGMTWDYETCGCQTCNEYNENIKPYYISDHTDQNVFRSTLACSKCELLRDKCVDNFIRPRHMDQYLKAHLCARYYAPSATSHKHPLTNKESSLSVLSGYSRKCEMK